MLLLLSWVEGGWRSSGVLEEGRDVRRWEDFCGLEDAREERVGRFTAEVEVCSVNTSMDQWAMYIDGMSELG